MIVGKCAKQKTKKENDVVIDDVLCFFSLFFSHCDHHKDKDKVFPENGNGRFFLSLFLPFSLPLSPSLCLRMSIVGQCFFERMRK